MPPLAFLITFACYGQRLHGDCRGTVDARNNAYGGDLVEVDEGLRGQMQNRMKETAYSLDEFSRAIVLNAILAVADHRSWVLIAAHVRTTHVHVVVHADANPKKILGDFKAYATRALKVAQLDASRERFWAEGGSRPYLWRPEQVRRAISYTLEQQGSPMAMYLAPKEVLVDLLGPE